MDCSRQPKVAWPSRVLPRVDDMQGVSRLIAGGVIRALLGLAAWMLLLVACAPVEPIKVDPATVASPHLGVEVARKTASLETYAAADGGNLAYLAYRSPEIPADTAVVCLHGLEDHAGTFALTGARLSAAGYHVYTLDRRGSGLNRENRAFASGDAASADQLLADLDRFVAGIEPHYQRVVLVGFAWGGRLALAYDLAHPDRLDGLVLVAPDLVAGAAAPGPGGRLRLLGAATLAPTSAMTLADRPELATADPVWRDYLQKDPLRLRQVTARLLVASDELEARIAREARSRTTPTLLVLSGQDPLVDSAAATRLLEQGTAGTFRVIDHPDLGHAIPLEASARLTNDIRGWLESFSEAGSAPPRAATPI
jgi:acylglycerol lipase